MKKKQILLLVLIILALLTPFTLYSQGNVDTNTTKEKEIVRISDTMPGLITPGVWNGQTFSLNSSVYEYLVALDATDNSLSPQLATAWNTDDGKVWNIEIREDVTFHDGSLLTSEDVKYTIERTQDTSIGHTKKADFAAVESIEIVDDYHLIITLKEKRPTFIYQFTDYNMAILSSEYDYATYGETKPMGTGAFRLKSLTPKESAVLVKNEDYWNPAYPLIDELQIYFSPDVEVSLSMLIDGQVDVVPFITPIMKQRIDTYPNLKVIIPYQEQRYLSMAVDRAPFDDNRVRLAFKYAMDPKMIARAANLKLGDGISYSETPIMELLPQYEPFPLRERDVEKAKSLLKEAGYPKGITVTLTYASDHAFNQGLVQAVKELAKEANINVELKGYPRDIYFAQYWLKEPFTLTTWGGRADPSMLLNLGYRSDGPWNESHLNDPKLDNLIDRISMEVDEEIRNDLYKELQQYFIENGAMINIQVPYFVAMNNKIAGYEQPLTMLPNYKKYISRNNWKKKMTDADLHEIPMARRKKREGIPTYVRIAQDIAHRIANGDIKEGKKLSGRSIMSSEYGVSPETIRRSFSLLEEMNVVSVQQNSGVIVNSAKNAALYVERHMTRDTRRQLLKRMHEIYDTQREAYTELMEITNTLVDSTEHFIASSPFYTYDCCIPPYSIAHDKSLSDMNFWQETKATVIAIKRDGKVMISPGPHEKLLVGDILVIVGKPITKHDVHQLLYSTKD